VLSSQLGEEEEQAARKMVFKLARSFAIKKSNLLIV